MDILALILAGGRVDDLGVLTFFRPKSAMPFGGLYRIIDFPMTNLMYSGVEKVGILSQYKPFYLMEHIGCGESWDMVGRNRFVTMLPPFKGMGRFHWYKGTADAVYRNLDFIRVHRPDLILILSGDHVYSMDYREVIDFHLEKQADLTVAFTKVAKEGAGRFGLASIEEGDARGGRILEYKEKIGTPLFDWASLTIYVFSPYALFEALEANAGKNSHEFGKDIIPYLLAGEYNVMGYKHYGYWGYTRTPEEYWRTSMDLLGAQPKIDLAQWQVCTNLSNDYIRDRQPASTGGRAVMEDSLIYAGCRIQGSVARSILFPGVTVESGAVVEDSILFFNTVVKQNARMVRTIADENVTLGSGAEVGEDRERELTIIGMGTRVSKDTRILSGVTVYPNLGPAQFGKKVYDRKETIQ